MKYFKYYYNDSVNKNCYKKRICCEFSFHVFTCHISYTFKAIYRCR